MDRASFYEQRVKLNAAECQHYIATHPQLRQLIQDFTTAILCAKPDDVRQFARQYFRSFIPENESQSEFEPSFTSPSQPDKPSKHPLDAKLTSAEVNGTLEDEAGVADGDGAAGEDQEAQENFEEEEEEAGEEEEQAEQDGEVDGDLEEEEEAEQAEENEEGEPDEEADEDVDESKYE